MASREEILRRYLSKGEAKKDKKEKKSKKEKKEKKSKKKSSSSSPAAGGLTIIDEDGSADWSAGSEPDEDSLKEVEALEHAKVRKRTVGHAAIHVKEMARALMLKDMAEQRVLEADDEETAPSGARRGAQDDQVFRIEVEGELGGSWKTIEPAAAASSRAHSASDSPADSVLEADRRPSGSSASAAAPAAAVATMAAPPRCEDDSDSDSDLDLRRRLPPPTGQPRPSAARHDSDSEDSDLDVRRRGDPPPAGMASGAPASAASRRLGGSDSDSDLAVERRQRPPAIRRRHDSDSDEDSDLELERRRPAGSAGDEDGDDPQPPRKRIKQAVGSEADEMPQLEALGGAGGTDPQQEAFRRHQEQLGEQQVRRKAGLFTGAEFDAELRKERELRAAGLHNLPEELSGASARTVVRDRRTGRKLTAGELEELEAGRYLDANARKPQEEDKPMEWGKGLAQTQAARARLEELVRLAEAPFAQSAEDDRLNAAQMAQERAGDPMAEFHRKQREKERQRAERKLQRKLERKAEKKAKKKAKKLEKRRKRRQKENRKRAEQGMPPLPEDDADLDSDSSSSSESDTPAGKQPSASSEPMTINGVVPKPRPVFQGVPWVNRFGIRPGYRWDGRDRSNGFEQRWFQAQDMHRQRAIDYYQSNAGDI